MRLQPQKSLNQEDDVKRPRSISTIGILLSGALCLCLSVLAGEARAASINVGLNIALPPVFRIAAPPPTVVIPGSYVYVVPDIDVDILFFRGAWYRPHEGHWFRASSYNGPWRFVAPNRMPREVVELPNHDYRRIPPGHSRIPYGQLKKGWKGWERNRHWDRDAQWREGWRKHEGKDSHVRDNGPGRPDGKERDRDLRDNKPRDFGPATPDGKGHGHEGRDRPDR
jgi:hypothetical protein